MHDYRKFKVSVYGRIGRKAGREQRGHPRRLASSSDFSQWVAFVDNISTLAPRLNGLSIANVAASSHSYDINSQRCRVSFSSPSGIEEEVASLVVPLSRSTFTSISDESGSG